MTKADSNTFIDEYFVQDSALVLLKGAFLSSVIEALCLKAPVWRRGQPAGFCQGFAPEFVTFVHFAKSQWTTDVLKIWSNLNMFLFAGTSFYASDSPIAGIRVAVILMVYYQAARSWTSTAASYQSEIKQDKVINIAINGVSSGLTAGGLSLLFAYRNTLQYRPLILLASSAGAALVTTCFYVAFGDSEKMNDSEKAFAVVGSVALAVAIAGFGAKVLARAGAVAGNRIKALAVTVAGTGAMIGAGAEARTGIFIIMMTGCISSTLLQNTDATAITRSLTVTAAAGLPLMVSSWLVSLERFAEGNVTMHETMQNEFIFSLPVSKVLSPANWVNWPTLRDWFTD